ncbi:hypothetical protein [Paraburkholderia sp. BL10I2N1]|uniref:hypothetical protein n=1 Tax=Paraburkholderia sp. BL10I2N1 TaxID=1938796 RepID=UPI00105CDB2C|nr:hypothetical protein [Paraburkholderia sp. BL10I2N1]TDN59160.1 hypothetical protein B0G77_8354 [Paraburkholderia sp. BL10I2N1]
MNTNEPQSPVWQPITALPVIFDLAGAQLAEAQGTFDALAQCRLHPHVLDDATLARTCQVYGEQRDFLPVQREQVARWRSGPLTPEQQEGVAHLTARMDRLAALLDDILALADELSRGTIDRIIGMSDADLAAAVLSGAIKLPQR